MLHRSGLILIMFSAALGLACGNKNPAPGRPPNLLKASWQDKENNPKSQELALKRDENRPIFEAEAPLELTMPIKSGVNLEVCLNNFQLPTQDFRRVNFALTAPEEGPLAVMFGTPFFSDPFESTPTQSILRLRVDWVANSNSVLTSGRQFDAKIWIDPLDQTHSFDLKFKVQIK